MSVDRWLGKGQIFKFCSKIIDFSIAAVRSSTCPKGKVVNDQAATFSWLRVPLEQDNLSGRWLQLVSKPLECLVCEVLVSTSTSRLAKRTY